MSVYLDTYVSTRERILVLAHGFDDETASRIVPACPEWTCRDLVTHVASMPIAISVGDIPGEDGDAWIDKVLDAHRSSSIDELETAWRGADEILAAIIDGPGLALYYDQVVHEHDLRGALGAPGAQDEPEVSFSLQVSLDQIEPHISAAGLAPLAIRAGDTTLQSGDGPPACTITTTAWEAMRALNGRRTADEVRALPHEGDVEPYLDAIATRFPFLTASLGEA
ncbi:MAG: hypothetical protein ACERLM_01620 [Acidimicrobiales bacterium]